MLCKGGGKEKEGRDNWMKKKIKKGNYVGRQEGGN